MRYFLSIFVAVSMFFCLLTGYAAHQKNQLSIYANPSNQSHVIAHISPWTDLVPIYHKKGWLKVGNSKNGQVGWIDLKQYHQLMHKLMTPQMETVVVKNSKDAMKPGKYKIVAYRNGKPLNEKEAKELLKHMQAQQIKMEHQFDIMQNQMDQMFHHSMMEMDHMMPHLNFDRFPQVEPLVLVIRPADKNKAKPAPHKMNKAEKAVQKHLKNAEAK